MYRKITVAVDNSLWSRRAENLAVCIALATRAEITGMHAYTGSFHESRFRALESYLPDPYRKGDILERQRSLHSVLISRGLELISTEYLDSLRNSCLAAGIPFRESITDGKNADRIIEATEGCDLLVMGALGLGSGEREGASGGLGSAARRALRHGRSDILIARTDGKIRSILLGIDGSTEAYHATEVAANLARSLGASLTLATSFDPDLHRAIFRSMAGVLSEEAGGVFRFSDQEKLHNEIIDRSLRDLYSGFLQEAVEISGDFGQDPDSVLTEGKPYQTIIREAEKREADLIVMGRTGTHRGKYADVGSNTEKVAESSGTNVLIVQRPEAVQDNLSGGSTISAFLPASGRETLIWSEEAEKRLERIPPFVRPMAILTIERYAKEHGAVRITPSLIDEARKMMGK